MKTVIDPEKLSPRGRSCGMASVAETCEGVWTVKEPEVFGVAATGLWSVESVPLALAVKVSEPVALAV